MTVEAETIFVGMLVPVVIAFGCLFPACSIQGPKRATAVVGGGALAIALAFFAAYALFSWTQLVPVDTWERLPYLVAGASIVFAIISLGRVPSPVAWFLRIAACMTAAWLLVPTLGYLEPVWYWWMGGLAVAFFGGWFILEFSSQWATGPWWPILMLLSMAAGAFVLLSVGSLKFCQLGCAGAASLVAPAALAFRYRDLPLLSGMMPAYVILLGGLMVSGLLTTISEVPWYAFALVLAAPLLMGTLLLQPGQEQKGSLISIIVGVLVILLLAAAVGIAFWTEWLPYLGEEEQW